MHPPPHTCPAVSLAPHGPSPDGPSQWEGTRDSALARRAPSRSQIVPGPWGPPPRTQMPPSRVDSEGKSLTALLVSDPRRDPTALPVTVVNGRSLVPFQPELRVCFPALSVQAQNVALGRRELRAVWSFSVHLRPGPQGNPSPPGWGRTARAGTDSQSPDWLCCGRCQALAGSAHGALCGFGALVFHRLTLGAGDTVASILTWLPSTLAPWWPFRPFLPGPCRWSPLLTLRPGFSVASVIAPHALGSCLGQSSCACWGAPAVPSGAGRSAFRWHPLSVGGSPGAPCQRPHSSNEPSAAQACSSLPSTCRVGARLSPSAEGGAGASLAVWVLPAPPPRSSRGWASAKIPGSQTGPAGLRSAHAPLAGKMASQPHLQIGRQAQKQHHRQWTDETDTQPSAPDSVLTPSSPGGGAEPGIH